MTTPTDHPDRDDDPTNMPQVGHATIICWPAVSGLAEAGFAAAAPARADQVIARWHAQQSVRTPARPARPPPSATGLVWSTSNSAPPCRRGRLGHLFRAMQNSERSASCASAVCPRRIRAAMRRVSVPQPAHSPQSRRYTWSRRYRLLLRSLYSWTQAAPQKVRLGQCTSRPHQRQPPPNRCRASLLSVHPAALHALCWGVSRAASVAAGAARDAADWFGADGLRRPPLRLRIR